MNDQPQLPKFISIRTFWKEMLGVGSRTWFYDHINDPGFPQPVNLGGRKMLVLAEAVEYMEKLMAERARAERRKGPPPKRRPGRPVELHKRLRS